MAAVRSTAILAVTLRSMGILPMTTAGVPRPFRGGGAISHAGAPLGLPNRAPIAEAMGHPPMTHHGRDARATADFWGRRRPSRAANRGVFIENDRGFILGLPVGLLLG